MVDSAGGFRLVLLEWVRGPRVDDRLQVGRHHGAGRRVDSALQHSQLHRLAGQLGRAELLQLHP